MDGSFIPPPFPFPEAWPRVFAEQQRRQERQWLTPTTFAPAAQWPAPRATAAYYGPPGHSIPASVDTQDGEDEDDEDGEYEFGYVLSDEWRERFQSSVQLQQLQKQKQHGAKSKKKQKKKIKQQRKTANAEAIAATSASRSGHLQREIQAAKTRDLARKWKRRAGVGASTAAAAASNPQVEAMEASLNMLFDEFCDSFQPAVWPHDPLH